VAVSGDTIVVGAPFEASNATGVNGDETDNSAQWAGAAYVFTRSGGVWSQQAYLKGSSTGFLALFALFGASVAVSGDTVVVGAEGQNIGGGEAFGSLGANAGVAYVFARSGGVWSMQVRLRASNASGQQTDEFGEFFVPGDRFGVSVAVSGDTVVVGAPWESSSATGVDGGQFDDSAEFAGAAYVFTRSGGAGASRRI
jgi:hypothetical protein